MTGRFFCYLFIETLKIYNFLKKAHSPYTDFSFFTHISITNLETMNHSNFYFEK